LIDTDEVVDDFMPQITGKAVELYCRSLPPQTLAKVEKFAVPFMPAVKDKARAELPGVIREKTDKFAQVPFAAIVLGANRYLDIAQNGETAIVKSKIADRPLEVKMRRNGDKWQIIGVKDDN
jgi:light-regulated signal transduction histidine kinase (bacteriophytochrome)